MPSDRINQVGQVCHLFPRAAGRVLSILFTFSYFSLNQKYVLLNEEQTDADDHLSIVRNPEGRSS